MTSTDPAPQPGSSPPPEPVGDGHHDRPDDGHGGVWRDRISVLGIEAFGHHGVLEHERTLGQTFRADVVLGVDTRAAAASDDLRDTVDYGSLVAKVRTAIESDPVDLIETLADRIVRLCLADDRVGWAEVTVHKPHAPVGAPVADVTVTVTRTVASHARSGTDGATGRPLPADLPSDQPERSRP